MDTEALPGGVMKIKLSAKAQAIANVILQAVKESPVVVTQLLQETIDVREQVMNGIVSSKEVTLGKQYEDVQSFDRSRKDTRALYMHNKSLIEVAGAELTHKLYKAVHLLKQDVLVNYPNFYISDNPKSSNDVLIGSTDSWSPVHQDLPLYCTSAILVLEGHKEFAVLPDEVATALRVNLSSGCWDQPVTHQGTTYPDLKSLAVATGGAVLSLQAGDMMVMPPRVFHLARNCAPTVSCNFSVCTMQNIPLTLVQTFTLIEKSPRDVMHFDTDFARLLADCTKMLLQQMPVRASSISSMTSRKRLPPFESILNASVRLMEWYTALQMIPDGWVAGFWGDLRSRLLDQLQAALPLHNRNALGSSGQEKGAAAAAAALAPAPAGPMGVAAADGALGSAALPASVPRPLSTGRRTAARPGAQNKDPNAQQRREGSRRSSRSDAAAAAATTDGGAGDDVPLPRVKRARLLADQGVTQGIAAVR